ENVDFVVANEDDKNQMDSSNPTKFGYQKGYILLDFQSRIDKSSVVEAMLNEL
ncbi:hypothetical protein Tco_1308329, partial [Tanacetum coccineum]